ncbi:MAG: ABC transporter ATP-binding protein [Deltaproteobacteria bacterium]|jgi:ABC-2 type transport system ATP-binding protein|nr:ABC transporter ATP-binding protein [Deltaproteobacteria bacterium]
MSSPFLSITGLSRSFGEVRALADISLTLEEGGRAALLGPNGAGKSTLMKIIGGTLSPDSGRISLAGLSPRKARTTPGFLGWMPERAPLNPDLTVREHLVLTAKFLGLTPVRTASEIERLTEGLNLAGKLERLTGQLSQGTRRQAALAAALLGSPRLVLLDEPTAGLDPDEVRRLRELLSRMPEETSFIISSHIIEEAAKVTGKALFLSRGRLVSQKAWSELGGDLEQAYLREVSGEII